MYQLLLIAGCGAVGCVARYGVAQVVTQLLGRNFPYGILTVNVIGSFLIGLLSWWFLKANVLPPIWRAGIIIGFLGGFTTFSSFSLDTINMLLEGYFLSALVYIVASVLLCLLATWGGFALAEKFLV